MRKEWIFLVTFARSLVIYRRRVPLARPRLGTMAVQYSDSKERFVAVLTDAQDSLFTYIFSLLPYEDLARDVLQETNIVLWRKVDEFKEGRSFMAWACGIARFQVKARRRDMQRDRLIFDGDLMDNLAVEAEQHVLESETSDHIMSECLDELPAEQRQLVFLRYTPGSNMKMLADKLGRSVGARKSVAVPHPSSPC